MLYSTIQFCGYASSGYTIATKTIPSLPSDHFHQEGQVHQEDPLDHDVPLYQEDL